MHPYLSHLIADIEAAQHAQDPNEMPRVQSIEEHFEEVERWISGEDPQHTFGYYCGLEAVNFPPADQFTDEEIKLVCNAFEHMLFTWNSGTEFPDKLPPAFRYKLMVNILDEGFTPVNSGSMTFDFCSGYAPDCIFKEYCSCLDMWNDFEKEEQEDNDEEMNYDGDELPF
jgi:hypothetical protein